MMQCENCCFYDENENLCINENTMFNIDDECLSRIDNEDYNMIYNKALDDVFKVLLDDTKYNEKYIYSGTIVEVLKQLRKGEGKTMKKVYISGKITGTKDYMERFAECEKKLTEQGYSVINPAKVNAMLPQDTEYDEYMKMSFTMLEMCDMIYMMNGWSTSNGACMEYDKARELGKEIMLE